MLVHCYEKCTHIYVSHDEISKKKKKKKNNKKSQIYFMNNCRIFLTPVSSAPCTADVNFWHTKWMQFFVNQNLNKIFMVYVATENKINWKTINVIYSCLDVCFVKKKKKLKLNNLSFIHAMLLNLFEKQSKPDCTFANVQKSYVLFLILCIKDIVSIFRLFRYSCYVQWWIFFVRTVSDNLESKNKVYSWYCVFLPLGVSKSSPSLFWNKRTARLPRTYGLPYSRWHLGRTVKAAGGRQFIVKY